MKLIPLVLMLFFGFCASAQDQFRADFNYVSFYNPEKGTWTDWEEASHTLVFNINENMDIKHYTAKGEVLIYRNLGKFKEDYTSDGDHYQIINALDDVGNELRIQLFDNSKIGMKLINGAFIVQFANF